MKNLQYRLELKGFLIQRFFLEVLDAHEYNLDAIDDTLDFLNHFFFKVIIN